jgi:hypothetical protein
MSHHVSKALALFFLSALLFFPGCGVFTDMAKDNKFYLGSFGLPDFISPVKLKVGILPFRDEVDLGTPEAGPNMAALMTEAFSESDDLVLISPQTVADAYRQKGWSGELTPEQAIELGRELNLNVIMDGAISQVDQINQRRGWRRLARFFTNQSKYIDAVLTLVAFDTENGLVISARAGQASYRAGKHEVDFYATRPDLPTQEEIENSLDLAIEDTYYRSLDGLAYTPFKAQVVATSGSTATINFGQDVGMKKGTVFVSLKEAETIVNRIMVPYTLPGEAKARLKVIDVQPNSSTLEITEGSVYEGEYVQSWEEKGFF